MNFYSLIKKKKERNPNYEKHGLDIPFYMLIISQSGGGKTNTLLNILSLMDDTFQKIVICLRSKEEPLYQLLAKKTPEVEFFENEVPDLDYFNDSKMSIIVFDDLVLDKQLNNKISEYYIRARKSNVCCCYISQSYYKIPKLIRINARYIILKKLSSIKDLNLILSEFDLGNKDQMLQLYKEATKKFTDFLLIDTFNNSFRKNFTDNIE